MIVLGIDVGTSSVKAALVDLADDAVIIASISEPYPIEQPEPDAAEVHPNKLFDAISRAVTMVVGSHSDEVAGVGLSCLTPGLCLLGATDQPLAPFRIHLDRRSRDLARVVFDDVGEEFLHTLGTKPLPGGISAVTWLAQVRRDSTLAPRVRRYLHLNSWLALCLTGQTAFDPGNASFTGLWNTLTDQRWSSRWCDYFGIEPDWLPAVIDGAATVGDLRNEIADQWHLRRGIPVKLGLADTSCGMVAADMQVGDLYHSVGTTQVLAALVDRPKPGLDRLTRHFGTGNSFLQVAHNPVGGVALTWLWRLCFCDMAESKYFDTMVPAAIERRTSVRLDPPYLGGDRLQFDARLAGFAGMSLSTERMDLLAAVLDAMRTGHQEAIRSLGVVGPFRRIILSGGGAEVVRRIIPDYANAKIEVVRDAAVRGAAKLFALT